MPFLFNNKLYAMPINSSVTKNEPSSGTSFCPQIFFKPCLRKSPGSLLLKANAPHFTILAVSDSYLQVTSTTREAILGKGFSEVFPEDEKMEDTVKAQNVFTRVVETAAKK